MNQVATRLKLLISEKEFTERRRLTYETISNETGIATSTLTDWVNSNVKRFDGDTIAKLCEYFNCNISDLLVLQTN